VDMDDNNHVSVEVAFSVTNMKGSSVDSLGIHAEYNLDPHAVEKTNLYGTSFNNNMHVPPGEYEAKFVVRDNLSGKVGSVSVPLSVK